MSCKNINVNATNFNIEIKIPKQENNIGNIQELFNQQRLQLSIIYNKLNTKTPKHGPYYPTKFNEKMFKDDFEHSDK